LNESFVAGALYVAGAIGLLAVGLVPTRVLAVLRSLARSTARIVWAWRVVLLAASAAAIVVDLTIGWRVFRCLTGRYCGPGVASGWTYLAILGLCYLAFEGAVAAVWPLLPSRR
jgi:hypothetical protein